MESFRKEKLLPGQKLIIFGAGTYGEIALRALEQIEIKPDFFADRTLAGKEYYGIPVIHPSQLAEYQTAAILIASFSYFSSMEEELYEMEAKYIYDISYLLSVPVPDGLLSEHARDGKNNHVLYESVATKRGELVLSICDITVTEKCTLRCRGCSHLTSWYQNPEHIDAKSIIESYDRLLEVVDEVIDMRLVGGEALLYPELDKLIIRYLDHPKIRNITIQTSGTVMPDKEQLHRLREYQKKKLRIRISSYEACKERVNKFVALLDQEHIAYTVRHSTYWCDFGNLDKRDESEEQVKSKYQSCTIAKSFNFYRGKLYSCGRSAHGVGLGYMPVGDGDCVDFTENEISINDKHKQIKELIYLKEFITACYYCNGAKYHLADLPAGVQLQKGEQV
jgi:organic radical activating enzyme